MAYLPEKTIVDRRSAALLTVDLGRALAASIFQRDLIATLIVSQRSHVSARQQSAIQYDCTPINAEIVMPHAIIRGKNGRRHEVDFGDAPVRVETYSSEETVEIFVEADFETLPGERRRVALLNIPRHLFSEATGEAARRAARPR